MSLLNAWITPSEAILGVDTLAAAEDGRKIHTSKVFPIAHLNAVLAWRGQSVFHNCLLMHCHILNPQTLDDLIDAMPEILARVEIIVAPHLIASAQVENFVDGNELVLAGWSLRHSRMLGWCFRKVGDMQHWQDGEILYCHAPKCDEEIPNEPSSLEKFAKAQVRKMNGNAGGTLVVCHLTRSGMMLQHGIKLAPEGIAHDQH